MNDNVIFVDTETTGLDPERHELWDIALIEADGTEHEWHLRPLDIAAADPGALRVGRFYERTGLPGWDWSNLRRDIAARQIASLTANKHLVGAVPWFDAAFLARFLRDNDAQEAWHYHMIDVETLAVGYLAGGAGKLWDPERATPPQGAYQPPWKHDGLAFWLVINKDDPMYAKHTAIGDARMAREFYARIMGA
jgi:hypothetical protein